MAGAEIGDWAIIGGMSGVHQFVRIGAHSMLGGASALVQDIPPPDRGRQQGRAARDQ